MPPARLERVYINTLALRLRSRQPPPILYKCVHIHGAGCCIAPAWHTRCLTRLPLGLIRLFGADKVLHALPRSRRPISAGSQATGGWRGHTRGSPPMMEERDA